MCSIFAFAAVPAGCRSKPRAQFPVTFTATADEPLAGVEIGLEGGKLLGATGGDGTMRVILAGPVGTKVPFRVRCPDGYRTPREMPLLTLRRLTGLDREVEARSIEVSIHCAPAERVAALVLRANRPGLPVLAQGREVARTDRDGVAHALVSMPPNSTFRVVFDTSADARLRPQNPATTLTLPDSDEIFVIDQTFSVEGDRPAKKRRTGRVERRPTGSKLPDKIDRPKSSPRSNLVAPRAQCSAHSRSAVPFDEGTGRGTAGRVLLDRSGDRADAPPTSSAPCLSAV